MKRFIILVPLVLTSCGPKSSNRTDIGGTADIGTILKDEVLLSDTITSQVDTAVSAVASSVDASTTSLHLQDSFSNFSKSCTENSDGTATVVVNIEKTFEKTIERTNVTGLRDVSIKVNKVRKWSQDNEIITCHSNDEHIKFDKDKLVGKKLEVSYTRLRDAQVTLTKKKNDKKLQWENKLTIAGDRTIEFIGFEVNDDTSVISKSVSINGTSNFTSTNEKKEEKKVDVESKTAQDTPLLIDVVRTSSTWAWVSRTIKSGTIEATLESGARVVTKFENVVYTEKGRCNAESGQITGSIFEPDATEALVDFTINFDGETREITFSDDRDPVIFDNSDCELNSAETTVQ